MLRNSRINISLMLSRIRLKKAISFVKPGRVLDAGCGLGMLADLLPDGCIYVGTDMSPEAVRALQDRGHRAYECDLQHLFLPEEPFDSIVSLAVIEHLPEPGEFLTRCHRMLNDDGVLVLTTPTPMGDRVHHLLQVLGIMGSVDEFHVSTMSPANLRAVIEDAGYSVTHSRRFQLGMNQIAVAEIEHISFPP